MSLKAKMKVFADKNPNIDVHCCLHVPGPTCVVLDDPLAGPPLPAAAARVGLVRLEAGLRAVRAVVGVPLRRARGRVAVRAVVSGAPLPLQQQQAAGHNYPH